MLGFAEILLGFFGVTFLPALAGLSSSLLAPRVGSGQLAAFGVGVFVFYFVDTFAGSSFLDLSSGFSGGVYQLALLVAVAVGLFAFVLIDEGLSETTGNGGTSLLPAAVLALALSLHGVGEGAAYGATVGASGAATLSDLLGGLGGAEATLAYALHKALEAVIIAACYVSLCGGRIQGRRPPAKDLVVLASVFVVPSLLGVAAGSLFAPDTSYFFALAVGSSLYVLGRLAGPFSAPGPFKRGTAARRSLAMLVGFLCIYIAAFLHS